MKTMLFKLTLIGLLIPQITFGFSEPGFSGKHTKEKTIKKEFSVNADALLKVDNSYGNLYITTWKENRTVIEVHIKTNSNNEEKAQKKLDQIDVVFDASSSQVSAKTVFEKSGWSWGWGNNNNVSMEINYTIKLPVTNTVDLSNDYGSINLDRIDGKAKISCDYGKLMLGDLNAKGNELSFDYTNNSEINFMNSGNISADYSSYRVEDANELYISADYTKSSVGAVKSLSYNCDYGNIQVDQAGSIEGKGDYLTVKLGSISSGLSISSDYGSIQVDRITGGDVNINSDYTGIKLGIADSYDFDFEMDLSYAGLGGDRDGFDFKVQREKSHENYYQGSRGSSGKNTLKINSEYGSVRFKVN
ncbi:hypothetical protein [Robertkochia sediminum]|uniref:hypothetical protein n=1 Tax=Robertkochia sediminum TaxID=2785326 RepID=UPI001933ADD6|nr:hypothetical protein [Robertkochia sediminum]MBL7473187.1 hypothetical protein [Robertkochia sediminum]